MERRRVVVTGLGAINAIGHNVEETWKSIKKVFVELTKSQTMIKN